MLQHSTRVPKQGNRPREERRLRNMDNHFLARCFWVRLDFEAWGLEDMPKEGTKHHICGSWIGGQCLDAADHSSMALRFGKIRELYNLGSQPRWLLWQPRQRAGCKLFGELQDLGITSGPLQYRGHSCSSKGYVEHAYLLFLSLCP